ncbi:glycosyltransferase [Streptomyces beigongshangae]|uniref:glycosyltransferase n=1 Tax=Streptomyces beigongshangae TaxID=2841597 RepID=UPI001C857CD4|nr:nucleotide disphospho-sugar-binding domain-containing protein [Streptomyces sp. REN17]
MTDLPVPRRVPKTQAGGPGVEDRGGPRQLRDARHRRRRAEFPGRGDGGPLGLLTALTHALAETGAELLVAVEDSLAARWKAPPAAVRHIGRLPLTVALPTCDVVVRHGGQGTSLTAMAAGRPQFVLPELDDRSDNARALEAAGAAVVLPMSAAAPEAVAKGCLQLLEDDRYVEAASRLAAVTARMPASSALVAPPEALALAGADR